MKSQSLANRELLAKRPHQRRRVLSWLANWDWSVLGPLLEPAAPAKNRQPERLRPMQGRRLPGSIAWLARVSLEYVSDDQIHVVCRIEIVVQDVRFQVSIF